MPHKIIRFAEMVLLCMPRCCVVSICRVLPLSALHTGSEEALIYLKQNVQLELTGRPQRVTRGLESSNTINLFHGNE
jgi:hypothetical protein